MTRTTIMKRMDAPITDRPDLHEAIRSIGRAEDFAIAKAACIDAAVRLDALDVLPEGWRPDPAFRKALDVEEGSAVAPDDWSLIKTHARSLLDDAARELAKSSGKSFERCYADLLEQCPRTATAAVR